MLFFISSFFIGKSKMHKKDVVHVKYNAPDNMFKIGLEDEKKGRILSKFMYPNIVVSIKVAVITVIINDTLASLSNTSRPLNAAIKQHIIINVPTKI